MIPKTLLITPPSESVISLNEIKTFLKIDNNDEDTLLEVLIESSTVRLEEEIGLKFIEQEWEIYFDRFGKLSSGLVFTSGEGTLSSINQNPNHLNLPFGKIINIDSFSTFDDDDNEYPVDPTSYQADLHSHYGKISLRYGSVWPATILRPSNGIKISGLFGISPDAANVPKTIKMAVMELTAAMYEYRGDEYPKIPPTALMLIEPYRRFKIGCR
jgi:hypothetical protein